MKLFDCVALFQKSKISEFSGSEETFFLEIGDSSVSIEDSSEFTQISVPIMSVLNS